MPRFQTQNSDPMDALRLVAMLEDMQLAQQRERRAQEQHELEVSMAPFRQEAVRQSAMATAFANRERAAADATAGAEFDALQDEVSGLFSGLDQQIATAVGGDLFGDLNRLPLVGQFFETDHDRMRQALNYDAAQRAIQGLLQEGTAVADNPAQLRAISEQIQNRIDAVQGRASTLIGEGQAAERLRHADRRLDISEAAEKRAAELHPYRLARQMADTADALNPPASGTSREDVSAAVSQARNIAKSLFSPMQNVSEEELANMTQLDIMRHEQQSNAVLNNLLTRLHEEFDGDAAKMAASPEWTPMQRTFIERYLGDLGASLSEERVEQGRGTTEDVGNVMRRNSQTNEAVPQGPQRTQDLATVTDDVSTRYPTNESRAVEAADLDMMRRTQLPQETMEAALDGNEQAREAIMSAFPTVPKDLARRESEFAVAEGKVSGPAGRYRAARSQLESLLESPQPENPEYVQAVRQATRQAQAALRAYAKSATWHHMTDPAGLPNYHGAFVDNDPAYGRQPEDLPSVERFLDKYPGGPKLLVPRTDYYDR